MLIILLEKTVHTSHPDGICQHCFSQLLRCAAKVVASSGVRVVSV